MGRVVKRDNATGARFKPRLFSRLEQQQSSALQSFPIYTAGVLYFSEDSYEKIKNHPRKILLPTMSKDKAAASLGKTERATASFAASGG